MSSSIATVVQSTSMKQSAINAVQQLLVENVAPMPTVTSTESPSGAGNVETKSEKKTRAPKKVKPTVDVVDSAVTEGDVAIIDSAKPEKKPRAPKKVKPTVDVVDSAIAVVDVATVDSAKPEKKPRAPKKVKPTVDVIEGAVTEGDVAIVDIAKPEKKPRAPKKVKPTVDVVDSAVTEGDVAIVDSAKPEKKPRAPKKVNPTIDNTVEPVVVVDNSVDPVVTVDIEVKTVDSAKPEKKPRAPKKVKSTVDIKIDDASTSFSTASPDATTVILQFIEKMSETQVIDKDTYNKLHQSLFPTTTINSSNSSGSKATYRVSSEEAESPLPEQPLSDTNVVVKKIVSSEQPPINEELEEGEEIEEELVTTEFVHKGVLYLKDADDNLYSRNPPHDFVLNLLE